MERKIYTTPRTKLFSVELEGTFAGSVVQNATSEVTSTGQQLHTIEGGSYDENDNFTAADWNDGTWEN